jgi:DNA-binding MarR family transcriptional regulator
MVRELPRFGRWALAVRDFETPYGKVGYRQLAILWALRYNLIPGNDVSPSDFAAHLEVQPSVVTRVLAKLESGGFIERTVDPNDGRRYHIRITEQGTHVSQVVEEQFVQELLAGVSFLDDDGVAALAKHIEILTDVVAILEENRKTRGNGARTDTA